jgi:hypothetical protein
MTERASHRAKWLAGVLFAYALVLQTLLAVPLASRHDLALASASGAVEHALCLAEAGAPAPAHDHQDHNACCVAACVVGVGHALAPASISYLTRGPGLAFLAAPPPEVIHIRSRGAGRGPAPRAPPFKTA